MIAPRVSPDDRLRVTYRLARAIGEATDVARRIAAEQTVELPPGCFDAEIEDRIVGRVESVDALPADRSTAVISYDRATIGDEVPQLFNLLFGNISLQCGIRVAGVEWPAGLLDEFAGPRFGIDGLRRLCRVGEARPLVCTALKPIGLSAEQLAAICGRFALGGVDLIKDDHGLCDQASARYAERVERCQQAVDDANSRTGGTTLYFPNVTAPIDRLAGRLEHARSCGCRGVLIGPLVAGLDAVNWIARDFDLAILAHPSLSGAYFQRDHGIAAEVLLGEIFRVIGADGVIYPNAGGRFPFSEDVCQSIKTRLRAPLGSIHPAFPVPAGGIDTSRVRHWIERYGPDTIFLIGGSPVRRT